MSNGHGLDNIDPRYVDATRASYTQVLRVGTGLVADFEDLITVVNPSGTTGDNGDYYFNNSGEFQTFVLNHDNSNINFDITSGTRGSYQVRIYNNSGNGSITLQEFQKFTWQGQKPPSTVIVPSGNHYIYALTYHGDYSSQYYDLKDWSAVFVSESP